MLKPWNMNWTSCLVRTHPEGEQGLDHMRLGHRIEVINEGFFYTQARAIIGRNDPDRINNIVKGLRLKARTIATREMRGGTPCEMPIMTWLYIDNLACHTLSEYPSKEEIKQLRKTCIALLDDGIDRDPKIVKEIYRTIGVTNTVLEEWFINEHHPLRFYAEKPNWFDRYSI